MSGSEAAKPICGIIMPISAIDGCPEAHWADVMEILTEAIEEAGFRANIVSNSDESGIIHKRIIQNLYDNPIVVCDVSGKNPNVMFELGMRLAFDKPTIIVKDDATNYSFDTSPIEHLAYPRDLRFSKIIDFKQKLAEKIASTYKACTSSKDYTTFLKHFGEFTVAKLDKKEISGQEYIIEEIRLLRQAVNDISLEQSPSRTTVIQSHSNTPIDICLHSLDFKKSKELREFAETLKSVSDIQIVEVKDGHFHLNAKVDSQSRAHRAIIQRTIRQKRDELVAQ